MSASKLDLGQTLGSGANGRQTGAPMRSPVPKTLLNQKAASDSAPKVDVDMGKTVGTSASGSVTGTAKAGIAPKSPKA